MKNLARIFDRQIRFQEFDASKNWIAEFPNENWCLVIIAEKENREYFDEIIRKAIDRNVAYIHSVGKQHDLIHDMADEELIFRDVDIEEHYLPQHLVMTTGEEHFENVIWFGIYCTLQDEFEIEQVIILDVTRKAYAKTIELIKKFESGYVPEA